MVDVVVVGAGPGGSATAYFLAKEGVKVTIIDENSFPRNRACGDVVSPHAIDILEKMGLSEWIRENEFIEPNTLRITSPNNIIAEIPPPPRFRSFGKVIPRFRLDEALLNQAIAAGARFVAETRAVGAERVNRNKMRVKGTQRNKAFEIEANIIVCCNGSIADFTKNLGLVDADAEGFAIRGYFAGTLEDGLSFNVYYMREILPGYAWIFPNGDGILNVGLGMLASDLKTRQLNPRQLLHHFIEAHSDPDTVLGSAITHLQGRFVRVGIGASQVYDAGVLVVGDAASLAHPLTGEGISSALESGELAAIHAKTALEVSDFSKKFLSQYARDLYRRYRKNHAIAKFLRSLMRRPNVANTVIAIARDNKQFASLLALAVTSTEAILPLSALRMMF